MQVSVMPAFANDTKFTLGAPRESKQHFLHAPSQVFQYPDIQAFLVGNISRDLFVTQPIKLNVEQDEDQSYVVSDDIFLVYGSGDKRSDAVSDYAVSLAEFYEIIEKSANSNQFDHKLFNHLQSYIQRRGNDAIQADRS